MMVLSTAVHYSLVAMIHVTDLTKNSGRVGIHCSSQIKSEMLLEIHTREKCYFVKPMIHSQIIYIVFLCFVCEWVIVHSLHFFTKG